jgi:hypothetical protein
MAITKLEAILFAKNLSDSGDLSAISNLVINQNVLTNTFHEMNKWQTCDERISAKKKAMEWN